MLDGLSLDQLKTFIAAAEDGSFSAAGRRLNRAQSVISQTIANLECQIGVPLFERSGRYPVLTQQGKLLLADARAVAASVNALKARAKGMASGVEPELSVAIDVLFPMAVLTEAAAAFGQAFPTVPLRIYVEVLGGVAQAVVDGRCSLGVQGSLPAGEPELVRERLLRVRMMFVAAPGHPLTAITGRVPDSEFAKHVQLVLTDRTERSKGQDFQVKSPRNWRLADLGAKHAFLRAGLGWGGMPHAMVERDLKESALVEILPEDYPADGFYMPMSATYRADAPPGPAGRWLVNTLRRLGDG